MTPLSRSTSYFYLRGGRSARIEANITSMQAHSRSFGPGSFNDLYTQLTLSAAGGRLHSARGAFSTRHASVQTLFSPLSLLSLPQSSPAGLLAPLAVPGGPCMSSFRARLHGARSDDYFPNYGVRMKIGSCLRTAGILQRVMMTMVSRPPAQTSRALDSRCFR